MTLRGGGKKGGGGGSAKTTAARKWSSSTGDGKGGLSKDQKQIFEAISKRMKGDKKNREKEKTTRTLANLLKGAGIIDGELEESTDSDDSSNDGLDALFGRSSGKKKKKSSKGGAATAAALASSAAKKQLESDLEESKAGEKRARLELDDLKTRMSKVEGSMSRSERAEVVDEIATKHTPLKTDTTAAESLEEDFLAECVPKGFTGSKERSTTIWNTIKEMVVEAHEYEDFKEGVSVNALVEGKVKQLAKILCETHLSSIPAKDIKQFTTDHSLGKSTTAKEGFVLNLLRGIASRGVRPLSSTRLGINSSMKPF